MGDSKKEIIICLGSSCFARGNKSVVKIISDYLKEHNLQNEVKFHGQRCFGKCANGPLLKLNDDFYEKSDPETIIRLLDDFLENSK
ncbi:MAG TPA: (2Fe-2S) ferredoxin domain-containing protein [Bacteroidales bacterium]|nr:(2Fe-2S) ferredoxin domain-containing protein [Bacteroidales bacterium]HPT01898.1 (2Fe-2S) ferredoxin domain-containing protein [Bacteroidales bacterium]